jgi:AraC family transcriptional regulator
MTMSYSTSEILTETSKARRATNSLLKARHFQECDLSRPPSECDILKPIVQISPIGAVKRHSASLHGLIAESIFVPAETRIEFQFTAPIHLLVMYVEGIRRDGVSSIEGLAPSRLRALANKLMFVPANHAYKEWHETRTPMRITYLYLDPSKLHSDEEDMVYTPKTFLEDSIVWDTAVKLKSVIDSGKTGNFYVDALANVLAHELSRSDENLVVSAPVSRGGLASWQTRIITQHIEDHLDEQISLARLARLARLSQSHFSRAFKQSFGVPPREYHIHRRIEEAKAMLTERDSSVTDVGFALGYSHTSSFSVAFLRITGRSPREFRRDFAKAYPETETPLRKSAQ